MTAIMENAFLESEAKDLADFMNFVVNNAKFDMNTKEAFEYARLYRAATSVLKKVEAHILEVKKIVQAKPEEKEAKEKPAKASK